MTNSISEALKTNSAARPKRRAISKKTRFEVFKRDGFRCMYCGAHPPAVLLHVDHIDAVARGGKNNMDNLVTACEPCNLGKSATPLSSVPQSLSDKAVETKEREAQIKGYQSIMAARRERIDSESWDVAEVAMAAWGTDSFRKDWRISIKHFIETLGLDDCLAAMERAVNKCDSQEKAFRYFCGTCWGKLRDSQGGT
jgi:HNH endonuclease